MRIYKAGKKFIAVHSTSTTVYTATGKTEQEVRDKLQEMQIAIFKLKLNIV